MAMIALSGIELGKRDSDSRSGFRDRKRESTTYTNAASVNCMVVQKASISRKSTFNALSSIHGKTDKSLDFPLCKKLSCFPRTAIHDIFRCAGSTARLTNQHRACMDLQRSARCH